MNTTIIIAPTITLSKMQLSHHPETTLMITVSLALSALQVGMRRVNTESHYKVITNHMPI